MSNGHFIKIVAFCQIFKLKFNGNGLFVGFTNTDVMVNLVYSLVAFTLFFYPLLKSQFVYVGDIFRLPYCSKFILTIPHVNNNPYHDVLSCFLVIHV